MIIRKPRCVIIIKPFSVIGQIVKGPFESRELADKWVDKNRSLIKEAIYITSIDKRNL